MASARNQVLIIAMLIVSICSPDALSRASAADMPMTKQLEQWMKKFGRTYISMDEQDRRFSIFKKNAEYIDSVNKAGDRKYSLGLNQFADMTGEDVVYVGLNMGFKDVRGVKINIGFRYGDVTDILCCSLRRGPICWCRGHDFVTPRSHFFRREIVSMARSV